MQLAVRDRRAVDLRFQHVALHDGSLGATRRKAAAAWPAVRFPDCR
ncbi:hypothetical protein DO73_5375 [Burkholderia pseudomallei]|nr:hypothetical protein DO73_5375 [Burkholderia pseudomallei]